MGSYPSKKIIRRNQEIDMMIARDLDDQRQTVKLLLLGSAESGKSTVLKQMRILHNNGFTIEEITEKTKVVYTTIIRGLQSTIDSMTEANLTVDVTTHDLEMLFSLNQRTQKVKTLHQAEVAAIQRLWKAESVQMFYKSSANKCTEDAIYFLENLERVCKPDYTPSEFDMLKLRVPTCGIVEMKFALNGLTFRVVDVGGQRSERKKWIHCFDTVQAIIFVTALSDYDRVMDEDNKTVTIDDRRMTDSLMLFDVVVNGRWFTKSSIILFLNKTDIFRRKISNVPLTASFPEFAGQQTYEDSISYISQKYNDVRLDETKVIYAHETCATDTNQVQLVLDSCIHMITKESYQSIGLE